MGWGENCAASAVMHPNPFEIYISFTCSSALKSKLTILKPIHNAGMQLVTGAFCINLLESIYAESDLLLCFWRDLLLCSYVARLMAHPHHHPTVQYSAPHYITGMRQTLCLCEHTIPTTFRKYLCESSTCLCSIVVSPPAYL